MGQLLFNLGLALYGQSIYFFGWFYGQMSFLARFITSSSLV
jgi:hypothetical protein